ETRGTSREDQRREGRSAAGTGDPRSSSQTDYPSARVREIAASAPAVCSTAGAKSTFHEAARERLWDAASHTLPRWSTGFSGITRSMDDSLIALAAARRVVVHATAVDSHARVPEGAPNRC